VKATVTPELTVGVIARTLHKPLHRIEYIIRARGIWPCGVAGNARIFTEADVQRISGELRRIDHEKAEVGQ